MSQRFLRARRPEHKQERREAILAAARALAAESGVRNVTLGGIAEAVGLAKSNVARYFGTREEIYLALTAECWQDWADEVRQRLEAGDDPVDVLAETLSARTLFCDLLGQMTTNLEHNVAVAAAADLKGAILEILTGLGAAIVRVRPDLTESEAFELAAASTAFAGVLYQSANPPPTIVEVYKQFPELGFAFLPFQPTMKRVVSVLLAGLPATRD
jgi:AcrR family transcriptional regulator